jgi:tripartite-type tricarboxylate transporter receptor subunit TctC
MMQRRVFTGAAAAGLLGLQLGPVRAQTAFPQSPITMYVGFAPGGGTDVVARLLARYIEKHLGRGAAVVIQNRPGAGGGIAFGAIANAAPDGLTTGFINSPSVLTIPIERKTNFTSRSFDFLGNVIDDPANFSVLADSPVHSLKDLAALARSKPGALNVGTAGAGSDDHLALLQFERAAGVKLNHIPFKGGSEVHTALLSKTIDVAAMNIGEAMQYAKGGSPLRQIGQMGSSRSVVAPDVPTFREQGYDIVLSSLRGIAAPKGLPAPVRELLVKAIQQAVADPEFKARALAQFAPVRYLSPAQFEEELRTAEIGLRKLWDELPWTDK